MGFQFKIDEAIEVYRDPIGHYHHWTFLVGNLVQGTIRQGEVIKIPLEDGTLFAAFTIDFQQFGKSLGAEVSAGQVAQAFGIRVWRPAPHKHEVSQAIAVDCTPEEYQKILLEVLEHHPERILHNRGQEAPQADCWECTQQLLNTPETTVVLRKLQAQGDPYIARRALLLQSRLSA